MSLDHEVVSAFKDVNEIESIFVLHRDDTTKVFTVVNENSEEISDKIAKLEVELCRRLDLVNFDFNTIARRNRPIQELLGICDPVWSRESYCQHLASI